MGTPHEDQLPWACREWFATTSLDCVRNSRPSADDAHEINRGPTNELAWDGHLRMLSTENAWDFDNV